MQPRSEQARAVQASDLETSFVSCASSTTARDGGRSGRVDGASYVSVASSMSVSGVTPAGGGMECSGVSTAMSSSTCSASTQAMQERIADSIAEPINTSAVVAAILDVMEDLDTDMRRMIVDRVSVMRDQPRSGRALSPPPEREWVNVCVRQQAREAAAPPPRKSNADLLLSVMSVPPGQGSPSRCRGTSPPPLPGRGRSVSPPPRRATSPDSPLDFLGQTRMSEASEQWVNSLIRATWPYVAQHIGSVVRKQLEGTLGNVLGGALRLCSLSLGDIAPEMNCVDVRTLADGSIRITTDVDWNAEVDVLIDAGFGTSHVGMSAGVDRVKVSGALTVVLGPPCPSPPYFNAVQVFFANPPSAVEVGLTGLGMLASSLPGVSGALHKAVSDAISNVLVLPKRVGIVLNNALSPIESARHRCPPPAACFRINAISQFCRSQPGDGAGAARPQTTSDAMPRSESAASAASSASLWDTLCGRQGSAAAAASAASAAAQDCGDFDSDGDFPQSMPLPKPAYVRVTMGGRTVKYPYSDSADQVVLPGGGSDSVFMVFCDEQFVEIEVLDRREGVIASTRRSCEEVDVDSRRATSRLPPCLRCGALRDTDIVRLYPSPEYADDKERAPLCLTVDTTWSGGPSGVEHSEDLSKLHSCTATLLSAELGTMQILPAPPVALAPLKIRLSAKKAQPIESSGGTVRWAKADQAARNDLLLGVLHRVEELGVNTEVAATITGLSTGLIEQYNSLEPGGLGDWLDKARQEHLEHSASHNPSFNDVLYTVFDAEEEEFLLELVASDGSVLASYTSAVGVGRAIGETIAFTPTDPRVGTTSCSLTARVVRSKIYC